MRMLRFVAALLVLAAAFVLLRPRPALADRDLGSLLSTTSKVTSVCFIPLPDGGASATVDGMATTADAGFTYTNTDSFQNLTGANRTTALDAFGKALTAWKNTEGL